MPKSLRIYSMLRHRRKQRPHKSWHSYQKDIHKRNVARRIRIIHIDENRRKKKRHAVNNFMEKQDSDDFDCLHYLIAQFHSHRQRSERVVEQYNVGNSTRCWSARVHRHAEVSLFQRQSVIYTIANHTGELTRLLESINQALFLIRQNSGKNRVSVGRIVKFIFAKCRQIFA